MTYAPNNDGGDTQPKPSHHDCGEARQVAKSVKRLEANGFFKSEPPPRRWRGVALRKRK